MSARNDDRCESLCARYGVVATLCTQSTARLERATTLGDAFAAAIWRNGRDRTGYCAPGHHTVSLYLEGGEATTRLDRPGLRGGPGRLCLLPADHASRWAIDAPMRFVHFYFDQETFAAAGVQLWGTDIRLTRLRDDTFYEEAETARLMRRIAVADWDDPSQRLALTEAAHDLLAWLATHAISRRETPRVKGGLSTRTLRRALDFIEAALHEPLTLGDLAHVAGLSEYHFARMFALSAGAPPHRYVLARRLGRARRLLRETAAPLSAIAEDCGFAHASHLSRAFRRAHGAPPDAWRRAIDGDGG